MLTNESQGFMYVLRLTRCTVFTMNNYIVSYFRFFAIEINSLFVEYNLHRTPGPKLTIFNQDSHAYSVSFMLLFKLFLIRAVVDIHYIQQRVESDLIPNQYHTTRDHRLGGKRVQPSYVCNITNDIQQIKQAI